MIKRDVTINNKLGLHARASAKLAETASAYNASVRIGRNESQLVDCKSIMALMMQAAGIGTSLLLVTEGEDELPAADAVCELFKNRFGEEE